MSKPQKYALLATMLAATALILFTPSFLQGAVYPLSEIRPSGRTIFEDALVVYFEPQDGPCAGADVSRHGADGQRIELTFLRPSAERKPDLETFYPDGPEGRAAVRMPFIKPRETYRLFFADTKTTEYQGGTTRYGDPEADR